MKNLDLILILKKSANKKTLINKIINFLFVCFYTYIVYIETAKSCITMNL